MLIGAATIRAVWRAGQHGPPRGEGSHEEMETYGSHNRPVRHREHEPGRSPLQGDHGPDEQIAVEREGTAQTERTNVAKSSSSYSAGEGLIMRATYVLNPRIRFSNMVWE